MRGNSKERCSPSDYPAKRRFSDFLNIKIGANLCMPSSVLLLIYVGSYLLTVLTCEKMTF